MSTNPDSTSSSSTLTTSSSQPPKKSQATSCAECRRLKLKCDRVFPCSSCIRRGCANLCPNAILEKGRRGFLKRLEQSLPSSANRSTGNGQQGEASTEVAMFVARDAAMSKRIQELESALINAGVPVPGLPHAPKPTRRDSTKNNKRARSSSEDEEEDSPDGQTPADQSPQSPTFDSNDVAVGFGTLTIDPRNRSRYIGLSGAAAHLDDDIWGSRRHNPPINHTTQTGLPREIENQILAKMCNLPTYNEAVRLANNYFENAAFMYEMVHREDFFSIHLPYIYNLDQPRHENENTLCADVFALVCMVLSLGQFFDLSLSAEEVEPRATEYFKMATFVVNCHNSIDGATKLDTIQGLQVVHLMTLYQLSVRHEDGAEPAWQLLGMVVRSIYAQGFHRDGSRWGFPEKDLELRRRVFWETYTYDRLQSFTLGRPYAQIDSHCDCRMPTTCNTPLPSDNDPSNSSWSHTKWHTHKFHWAVFIGRITDTAFSVKPPTYSTIMQLDREINDFYFSLPQWILCPSVTNPVDPTVWRKLYPSGVHDPKTPRELHGLGKEEDKRKNAQIYTFANMIFLVILHIHRGPFCRALMLEPQKLIRSRYEASIARVISSSTAIINITRGIFMLYPKLTSRIWYWIFHSFTAAVCQAVFVIVAPFHPLAPPAFRSLQAAIELFENADSQRARSSSARLQYLASKAALSMQAYRDASQQAKSRNVVKLESSHGGNRSEGVGIVHESSEPMARFPESNVRKNAEVFLGASTQLIRLSDNSSPPPPVNNEGGAYRGLATPSPPSGNPISQRQGQGHEHQPQSTSQERQPQSLIDEDPFAAMMGLYNATPLNRAPERNVYAQQAPYPPQPTTHSREDSFTGAWLPPNVGVGSGAAPNQPRSFVAPKLSEPNSQSSTSLMDAPYSFPTDTPTSANDLDQFLHQFDWKTIFYLQNNGSGGDDPQSGKSQSTGAGPTTTFDGVSHPTGINANANANMGSAGGGAEGLAAPLETVGLGASTQDGANLAFMYGGSTRFNEMDAFNLSSFIQDGANAWMYDPSMEVS